MLLNNNELSLLFLVCWERRAVSDNPSRRESLPAPFGDFIFYFNINGFRASSVLEQLQKYTVLEHTVLERKPKQSSSIIRNFIIFMGLVSI